MALPLRSIDLKINRKPFTHLLPYLTLPNLQNILKNALVFSSQNQYRSWTLAQLRMSELVVTKTSDRPIGHRGFQNVRNTFLKVSLMFLFLSADFYLDLDLLDDDDDDEDGGDEDLRFRRRSRDLDDDEELDEELSDERRRRRLSRREDVDREREDDLEKDEAWI